MRGYLRHKMANKTPTDRSTKLSKREEIAAARSWINKFVRDMYPEGPRLEFGLVRDVSVDPSVRLLAYFPGESEPRRIALEPTLDGHYLCSRDVKARYRMPSEADLDRLRALGRKR